MMRCKTIVKYIWLLLGLLSTLNSFSQPDPMFTMYFQNMQVFNPAYAGTWQTIGLTALNRIQWLGIKGHPSTQTFSVQAPLRTKNVGFGFNVVNDKIGLEKRLAINLDYSYRINLSRETSLRFGLKAGFTNNSNPLPFYTTYDPGDPNYYKEINSKFTPNLGAGVFLSNPHSYLGLSVPRLIKSTFAIGEEYIVTDHPELFASGGFVWNIAEEVKFKPAFITKMAEQTPFQFDLSANFLFNDKFWLGSMYRSGDAIGVIAQWIFNQKLRIGYAYDFTTTDLQHYQNGVHEVMISYELNYIRRRYASPRYF